MIEEVITRVDGMTCSSCANTVAKTFSKAGAVVKDVNYLTAEVVTNPLPENLYNDIRKNIQALGYTMPEFSNSKTDEHHEHDHNHSHDNNIEKKFFWSLIFTLPLVAHMFIHVPVLANPIFQLIICLPVMFIGWRHFGVSAVLSLRAGAPNMDVLIALGSTAAFAYSLSGTIMHFGQPELHQYLFYKTAATIITLVLLGNVIEHRSVKKTTSAIAELSKLQPQQATKINVDGSSQLVNTSSLIIKDRIKIVAGEGISADGKIVSGDAVINEAMITGESIPVTKSKGDLVTGGTIVENGVIEVEIISLPSEGMLSRIIQLVKQAQRNKPEIQKIGDKVSAIFVPAVAGISIITFLISYFMLEINFAEAVMRSIAVLVISCPCAMGLATPTAVMVGIGRAAKNGILMKGGNTLEMLANVKTVAFDKTGTLTTGQLKIKNIQALNGYRQTDVERLLFSIESNSNHPIAKSIVTSLKTKFNEDEKIRFASVHEDRGIGLNLTDSDGNIYSCGSHRMVKHLGITDNHQVYLLKNNLLIATVDLDDELKSDVHDVLNSLRKKNIETVLISGDKKEIVEPLANDLGFDQYYAAQLPDQKQKLIAELNQKNLTAMAGDGINDAPSLAQAHVGISMGHASATAIASSQVILLSQTELHQLIGSIEISKATLLTIKQNLFWAFFYNLIAIPLAAAGFMSPMLGALSMAFSDVVIIGNSLRLNFKKLK